MPRIKMGFNRILLVPTITGFLLYAAPFSIAHSQAQPQFLFSWHANNLVASGFTGKSFPLIGNTLVGVSFEVLRNGTILNLSQRFIKIFINDQKYIEGRGVQQFQFTTNGFSRGYAIKILVLDSADGNVLFEDNETIPVSAAPEITITTPAAQNTIPPGTYLLRALPYFFNISSINGLGFQWHLNGKTTGTAQKKNPDYLELEITNGYPAQSILSIDVTARNNTQNNEVVSTNFLLTTQ